VNVGVTISASPNATINNSVSETNNHVALKSISDYNASNPTASTATTSATKILSASRKSSRLDDGVSAKCQRKGCQVTFIIDENSSTSCRYHKGQPVFHDAVKFWSCCYDKKCFDFDEFLKVPGCTLGYHDDGVVELAD
jgi:hypothetical protein